MKNKIALTIAAALFMFGAVSCKKDYTCVCELSSPAGNSTVEAPLNNVSKKDAKNSCEGLENTYGIGAFTADCKLK